MKTTLKLFGLLAIVFLASCTNTSILKRKYNNGYYVSTSSKVKKSDVVNSKNTEVSEPVIASEESIQTTNEEIPVTASVSTEPIVVKENNVASEIANSSAKENVVVNNVKTNKTTLEKKAEKAE